MPNNRYAENKNRFKCDIAHYLRAGIGKCIPVFVILVLLVNINPVAAQVPVVLQTNDEFLSGAPVEWYSPIIHQRAYAYFNDSYPEIDKIFVDSDAFFFGNRDLKLLLAHEQGHIDGKDDELFGVMSGISVVRLLTTWGE